MQSRDGYWSGLNASGTRRTWSLAQMYTCVGLKARLPVLVLVQMNPISCRQSAADTGHRTCLALRVEHMHAAIRRRPHVAVLIHLFSVNWGDGKCAAGP